MHLIKALIAEFIGTFALIFIGAGAAIALDPTNWVATGLAHGLVIMVFAYALGMPPMAATNASSRTS